MHFELHMRCMHIQYLVTVNEVQISSSQLPYRTHQFCVDQKSHLALKHVYCNLGSNHLHV